MWYTKTDVEKFGMLIQNVIDKRSVNYSFPSKVLIGKLPSDNFIIFLEIEFAHTKIKQRYDFTSFIVKRAKSVASIFGHWHSDGCMINVPPTPPRNLRNWYTWLYKKKQDFGISLSVIVCIGLSALFCFTDPNWNVTRLR